MRLAVFQSHAVTQGGRRQRSFHRGSYFLSLPPDLRPPKLNLLTGRPAVKLLLVGLQAQAGQLLACCCLGSDSDVRTSVFLKQQTCVP